MSRFRFQKTETGRRSGIGRAVCMLAGLLVLSVCLSACGEVRPLSEYERGMAYLESGDRENALACFENCAAEEGEEALGLRGQGLIYQERGDYDLAIRAFSDCLDAVEHPRLNKAFVEDVQLYLAQSYTQNGKPDKAITLYSQMLRGDRAGAAYLLRGKLYARDGKFGQAGQDFQRAVELDPSFEVYLQIYDLYVSVNRQADGAVFLREAQSKTSGSAEDAYQLGRINYFLGEFSQAKENLLKAMNKAVPGAAALLGRVYLDEGDISGARTVFQNAIDYQIDPAAGHNGLALCMIQTGEYQKALQQIHEGMLEGNTDVLEELLFNEIVIYEHLNDYQTALEKMESFLNNYPGNEDARKEYQFLQSRIREIDSIPEDVSGRVWEDIVRQWEEEAEMEESGEEETYDYDYGYEEETEETDTEENAGTIIEEPAADGTEYTGLDLEGGTWNGEPAAVEPAADETEEW